VTDKAQTTETEENLKALTPLHVADQFDDFPMRSNEVYIVSDNCRWIIAKDIYRPLAEMIVAAFNEKYGIGVVYEQT
jgi:hypothetical protein